MRNRRRILSSLTEAQLSRLEQMLSSPDVSPAPTSSSLPPADEPKHSLTAAFECKHPVVSSAGGSGVSSVSVASGGVGGGGGGSGPSRRRAPRAGRPHLRQGQSPPTESADSPDARTAAALEAALDRLQLEQPPTLVLRSDTKLQPDMSTFASATTAPTLSLSVSAGPSLSVEDARTGEEKRLQRLLHQLFVCISGVADVLQTTHAADIRYLLRHVFNMYMDADPALYSPVAKGALHVL